MADAENLALHDAPYLDAFKNIDPLQIWLILILHRIYYKCLTVSFMTSFGELIHVQFYISQLSRQIASFRNFHVLCQR